MQRLLIGLGFICVRGSAKLNLADSYTSSGHCLSFRKGNIIPLPQDKEMRIRAELMFPKSRDMMQLNDCFVPHLQPQHGGGFFTSAFGCKVRYFEHTLGRIMSSGSGNI